MRLLFKTLGVVFGLLFLVSALLQYNDPDPIIWILIYGVATVVSFMFVFNKASMWLLFTMSIISFAGFIYVYPAEFQGFNIGEGDIKNIEEGRESFGLLIMSLAFCLFAFRKKIID